MRSWMTVLIACAATVAPALITAIPNPYKDIAIALMSAAGSIYHLYQPSPSDKSLR